MTSPPHSPRDRTRGRRVSRARRVSLSETLDRVLHKGAVLTGDLVISVADVELVYISLNALVASVDTVRDWAQDTGDAGVALGAGSRLGAS